MAIFTVGLNSTYPSIAAAMLAAGPNDTIQLEAGYSNETAVVTHTGMIITGDASSVGIVLQLGNAIATVALAGAAPINLLDAADGNGIVSNDGNNLITVTAGADSVSGGLGHDRLFVDYRLATGAVTGDSTSHITEAGGGARMVTINGGFEDFTIWTGAGADTITTGAGDDDIRTGEGAGTVTAGEGANTIIGGSGEDTITAGSGGNFVDAGDGANTITTGGGTDEILSGRNADTIIAGAGNDRITALGGADTVNAGAGIDLLIVDYAAASTAVTGGITGGNLIAGYTGHIADLGGATLDFVEAERFWVTTGTGNDSITTGAADDMITTGAGNDLLNGGGGDDILVGGAGTDTAIFSGNYRNYTVTVFAGGDAEVRDNRPGSPDGTDRISRDVELLRFADGVVAPGQSLPSRDVRSDFNGDGRSDVAWLHSGGAFTSWAGQANGAFVNANGSGANPLGIDWKIVGIGDFNGDGIDDLLWRHGSGEIGQWQGQSSGTFVNTSRVAANAVDNSWSVTGVADYNGDGRDDILWRHSSGAITEWLAQPGGSFTNNSAAAANTVDTSWKVVASGDFDADGRADVLWQHSGGAFVKWQGTATGALVNAGSVMAGAVGTVIGSADFNGDGRDDILTRAENGTITEWFGQSSGQFTAVTPTLQVGDLKWDVVGLGDYNGDGFDDLLWRHGSGEFGEWLGSANGQFSRNAIIPSIDASWQTQSPDLFMI